jgi:hypothetical protein
MLILSLVAQIFMVHCLTMSEDKLALQRHKEATEKAKV